MNWTLNKRIIPLFTMSEGGDDEGGGGGGDETWHAKLPEDLKANETLAQFKDEEAMIPMPVTLAKSYIHSRSLIGADTIKMPKTDEDWEALYTDLGRPETADQYLLQQAEDVNSDLQESLGKDAEWFRGVAHKLGLNDKQTTNLFKEFTKQMSDKYNEMQTLSNTESVNTEVQMRVEYGSAYDAKKELTKRALAELGGSEFMELINKTGVSNSPVFIRAMFKVGDMMAEDLGLDKSSGQLLKSKSSVTEEIAHIQSLPAYTDGNHAEHVALVQKVAKLYEQMHGKTEVPATSGALR